MESPSKFSLKLGSRNQLCQSAGLQFSHLITSVSTIKNEDSSYRIRYTGFISSPSKLRLRVITRYLTIQFNFRFHGAYSFHNLIVNKYILYHQPRSEFTDYSSSLRDNCNQTACKKKLDTKNIFYFRGSLCSRRKRPCE